MRTIREVQVHPVRVPVTATFRFSSGSAGAAGERAGLVLVRVVDSEGCHGWGEGRPMPQWSYETLETVTTVLRLHLGPAVLGTPVTDRWELHHRMHAAIGRGPSTGQPVAKAALDLAVHDLCARAAGLPLRCVLGGGPQRRTVALSHTVMAHDGPSAHEEVTAARAAGFRHFNFKVAVEARTDLAVAGAVRDAAGPEAFVWADANQGLTLPQALALAPGLADAGVDLLEQPFPADRTHLMRALRLHCPLPLAVDESTVSPADLFTYVAAGLVDSFVLKLTRSGGIFPSVAQLHVADAAGLPFVTSGLTDGLLTKLAACQVATAFGSRGPAALNGSQFLDESALYPRKAEVESNGEVRLPDTPGIGVEPDPAGLAELAARDLS
jgi:L-alanine-DL-glutamate epimerase-like enolase superfamily enzyme